MSSSISVNGLGSISGSGLLLGLWGEKARWEFQGVGVLAPGNFPETSWVQPCSSGLDMDYISLRLQGLWSHPEDCLPGERFQNFPE